MKLNILELVIKAGLVVKLVLIMLVGMSVISWAIIILKIRILKRARRNSDKFLEYFWSQRNMENAYKKSDELDVCPVAAVFRRGYVELTKVREASSSRAGELSHEEVGSMVESVERALRRSVTTQLTTLERRVPFLATTGSSAPFIGLFGTVWGIMNSFLNIGATGATNLAVVAPGISEALIATAVGLFAAIPAVIGYNYCVSQIRVIHREMENFSNDFLNMIKRQLGSS
jgi:biopolymer transport protein TolQ